MKKRLLSVNVHYSPRSFGGATIVAEEVNRLLAESGDWSVVVITTESNRNLLPYQITRYRSKGVSVVSVNVLNVGSREELEHGKMADVISDVLDVFMPDVVHLHAIQTMGLKFIEQIAQRSIPIAATLHDCWWLCERQFMINKNGKYCFQKVIEKEVCLHCVDNQQLLDQRWNQLRSVLSKIDQYIFPSEFHMGMHILNGVDPEKCMVNKNGVKFPQSTYRHTKSTFVRFGFIGGPGFIKGGELIQEVFKDLKGKYKLSLVNAAQNVGQSWENDFGKLLQNKNVELVDAYDQDSIDSFFSTIDVLLFPSQWKESFGLTVREAMVRDVWVISTKSGGTVEDMRDGENATVIPLSMNPKYLKKAVMDCLERDWREYTNPHKEDVRTYLDQANELDAVLTDLIQKESLVGELEASNE